MDEEQSTTGPGLAEAWRKEYKESRPNLRREICKAKEKGWEELLEEVEGNPWERPYKVVMGRLGGGGQGIWSRLEKKEIEKLLEELFPWERRW